MRFKKNVLQKIISVFASILLLVNSFAPYLLIAPILNPVKAQEETVTPTSEPAPTDAVSPAPTAEPTLTPIEIATPTPTVEVTPTETPTPTIEVTPTSESTVTPETTPTATPTPKGEILDGISASNSWNNNADGSFTSKNNVSLNTEYIAPFNNNLIIKFTKLPENPSKVTIKEISASFDLGEDEQVGSVYEITSEMQDGEFAYDLSLPIPEGTNLKNLEVKYAESLNDLINAEVASEEQIVNENSLTVKRLDHMTVFVVSGASATATIVTSVSNLDPSWDAVGGGGVFSAYIGPPDYDYVSPGATTLYSGREAGIIKAGFNTTPADDEGLFAFKPTVTINAFAAGTVTYDVENQTGVNPVWMTIEIDTGTLNDRSDNTTYQFVPTSNPAGWHAVDAGAGQWQKWNDNNGDTTGNPLISLSDVATTHTGLNVVRTYLRLGMGESYYNGGTGTIAWVDKTTIGGVTFDFVVGAGSTPTSCTGASITPPDGTTACYSTIQAAIDAADPGETINVAAGTYTEVGQIVIDKNLSIVGADKTTTIIKPAQDTGNTSSGNLRGWFLVNSGVTFNLSNVTLDGSSKLVAIGILSRGDGTIENNIIKNIGYNPSTDYYGRGIQLYDTNMTVQNNTLQNIGRIGIFGYGSGVTSATIKGNNYTGKGIGNWLDYGIELGGGAVATISNNIISGNRGVASVDGSTSAGILVSTYFATGTQATITGNTLTDNTDGIAVGYNASDTSAVVAHNNSLSGNIEHGINSTAPTVDATKNWWGSTCPDFNTIVSGSVTHTTWYIDAGMTMLNSDIDSIFDGVSSTLASQGIVSNIGDATTCNYTSFPNLSFEKRTDVSDSTTALGKITFSLPLDLSSNATQTFLQNLGSKMEQSNGRIALDVQTSIEFTNKEAVLVMYGLTPGLTLGKLIVRDDANTILNAADVVSGFSQDPTTYDITFNAAHFTQFDIDTTAPTKPVADSAAGDYTTSQSVTLVSSDNLSGVDKIYYTTDDTAPNNTKTEYITAITVDKDMTIKAIAYDKAGNASDILEAIYGIAPVISSETSSSVTSTTSTITWTTDDLATSRVIYDTVTHPDPVVSSGETPLDKYGYASTTDEFDSSPKLTDHSVGLTGLTAGTTYYYRTVSRGSPEAVSGESSFTTLASSTTTSGTVAGTSTGGVSTPTCSDTKPGSAPSGFNATAGLNSVTLTWNKASDPVSYYLVTYGLTSGSQEFGNPNVGDSSTTSYTVSNLSGGITYYFKVRAGNGCAPGEFSSEVAVTPSGGFVEGPATGFAPGVLGEATEEAKLKEEVENKQTLGKFTQTLKQNNLINYLPYITLLLIIIFIILKRKRKNMVK